MIKSWVGKTGLSFNWTTNALETLTCISPFVSDLLSVFADIKWPRSFLLWINIKKGKGRKVKISLSKSSSRSIFQRARLDHNFSHSPVTSCKIIPLHMKVIKQSSSFDTESAHWLWWQDKSNPTTHTVPAYLEKSDSSATNGEGCAVKAACPRLWGIHITEKSDSSPLGWFSTQRREAKGLLPLNYGTHTTKLHSSIHPEEPPSPFQTSESTWTWLHNCPRPAARWCLTPSPTLPLSRVALISPGLRLLLSAACAGGKPACLGLCFLLYFQSQGCRNCSMQGCSLAGKSGNPQPRKCRCSIISRVGSALQPLHLPPFPQYNPTYFTAQQRGKHQAPDHQGHFRFLYVSTATPEPSLETALGCTVYPGQKAFLDPLPRTSACSQTHIDHN